MNLWFLLPSAQFTVLVSSIALSAGLVLAADYVIKKPTGERAQIQTGESTAANTDWRAALEEVQSESGITLPPPPDQNIFEALLSQAKSENLTDTVGRTLLVSLIAANAQGLGSDIPTQERLAAQAATHLERRSGKSPQYTAGDLTIAADNASTLRAFGNAVMQTLADHSDANAGDTLLAIGYATDYNDATYLEKLSVTEQAYRALAEDLLLIPSPQTLSPLYLHIVNNFLRIADTYPDMKTVLTDPLRGLVGVQRFQSLIDETNRVFITIAEQLQRNAILFTKDEPGKTWGSLVGNPL